MLKYWNTSHSSCCPRIIMCYDVLTLTMCSRRSIHVDRHPSKVPHSVPAFMVTPNAFTLSGTGSCEWRVQKCSPRSLENGILWVAIADTFQKCVKKSGAMCEILTSKLLLWGFNVLGLRLRPRCLQSHIVEGRHM